MCYATGNTLALLLLLLWSSLQWQHQTTHTATFMVFGLRIPTVAAKLPIIATFNKQAKKCNAFVWFGTAVETLKEQFFRTPKKEVFEESADISN